MNKMLATIKAVDTKASGPGAFEAILSVPTKDRDGEIVDAGAFNPLPPRINIDVDHAMTVEKTVGSGVPFYDGEVLKIKGTFASTQLGQDVRTLVNEGHIDSLSVAYMSSVYEVDEKDGLPHLRKAELLNAGIVGIPANREAIITMSKTYAASAAELADAIIDAKDAVVSCPVCATKSPDASDEPTTETDEKAAEATDVKSPAAPAGPQVDVAHIVADARKRAATTQAALLPDATTQPISA